MMMMMMNQTGLFILKSDFTKKWIIYLDKNWILHSAATCLKQPKWLQAFAGCLRQFRLYIEQIINCSKNIILLWQASKNIFSHLSCRTSSFLIQCAGNIFLLVLHQVLLKSTREHLLQVISKFITVIKIWTGHKIRNILNLTLTSFQFWPLG
jgi:hypothetical protein